MINGPILLSDADSEPLIRAYLTGQAAPCPNKDGGCLALRYFEDEAAPTTFDAQCDTCGSRFKLSRPTVIPGRFTEDQRERLKALLQVGRSPVSCPECGSLLKVTGKSPYLIPRCIGCGRTG